MRSGKRPKQHLEVLYANMVGALTLWQNATRPREWNAKPETILYNTDYLERASTFREELWKRYLSARKKYEQALSSTEGKK